MEVRARRLHPATLLFHGARVARGLIIPAVAGALSMGGGAADVLFWLVIFLGPISISLSVARWLTFRYDLDAEGLRMSWGLVSRSERAIPRARIQNVELRRSLLQRLTGVAELRIETAGGGGDTEAVLSLIGAAEAEALRAALLERAARTDAAPDRRVIARLGAGDLALAGATGNEAGLIAAVLAGSIELFDERIVGRIESAFESGAVERTLAMGGTMVVVLAVLALLVFAWLLSIAGAMLRYHGFTLERTGDELHKRYGALAHTRAVVPLERVQALRIEQTLLRRVFGLVALRIETAGAAGSVRGGAEAFVPLARERDVPRLIAALYPRLDLDGVELLGVHPRARRRLMTRAAAIVGVATLIAAVADPAGWLVLALLPPALLAGSAAYRARAYGFADGFVVTRAGVLTRTTWIVPEMKVQTVRQSASPLQRRVALATLVVDTAAGPSAGAARVRDLAAHDAAALLERIGARAVR